MKFVGKEGEICAIGDRVRGEGGGDDFLRYFRGKVLVAMNGAIEKGQTETEASAFCSRALLTYKLINQQQSINRRVVIW